MKATATKSATVANVRIMRLRVILLTLEVIYCILEYLLALVACDILKEVLLITLCVSHLTQDLTTLADDTLDAVA
jgi:hypothetical protein